MLCPSCGNFSENVKFCRYCGVELQSLQPIAAGTGRGAAAVTARSLSRSGELPDPLVNRTLDQRYSLEARLGAGGMGAVYRAQRLMIGDTVAVKVLHSDLVADQQALERFRREVQTAAMLKHPNLVTIFDFGITPDRLVYLVMELVDGINLRDIIRSQGPLTPAVAAEIVNQVCAALDEAHRQGVVHRDLKPENIVVQNTPGCLHVKVLDFGSANLLELATNRLTPYGAVMGTPQYMSPEQCQGEALDGRSDIYSLGVILYEMLTGDVPFDSPTPTAIAIKHVNQPPPPLRTLQPHLPTAVEAAVLHGLAKQREARPQTAGVFAQELFAAINSVPDLNVPDLAPFTARSDSAPVHALVSSEADHTSSWDNPIVPWFELSPEPPKRPLVPILVGIVLLFAATAFGFWWFQSTSHISVLVLMPAR